MSFSFIVEVLAGSDPMHDDRPMHLVNVVERAVFSAVLNVNLQ